MSAPMLQVQGLTKIFGGLKAVDNASLKVDEGRIVALIGPNGAGKTTLFACIAGFLPVNTGQVTLLGQDITGWPVPSPLPSSACTRTSRWAPTSALPTVTRPGRTRSAWPNRWAWAPSWSSLRLT